MNIVLDACENMKINAIDRTSLSIEEDRVLTEKLDNKNIMELEKIEPFSLKKYTGSDSFYARSLKDNPFTDEEIKQMKLISQALKNGTIKYIK